MPRTPRRFAVHLLFSGGHREVVNFATLEAFQQWYSGVLNAGPPEAYVNVPINDLQGEYLVVRPSAIVGIRVEPQFAVNED
ncbi:hypothetical protein [Cyanobium sp. ATX 6F1]|jgi:hypothetical protein|uniref:hypothetical protein n=1 Tax=unclassified Cyanobium TaxID=2627006 RepID=UPI0020CC2AA7|nr:hypothetical protein [Cyanobium sp. ATX 6F1]MCP9915798.1 hypothetical protein [Cyanobium sp. ATX 6F1]